MSKKRYYAIFSTLFIFSILFSYNFLFKLSSELQNSSIIEKKSELDEINFQKISGISQFSDIGDNLYLTNDYLNISLKKSLKGGIDSIIDRFTNIDYCNSSEAYQTLFAFTFYNSTYESIFFQWDASDFKYDAKTIDNGFRLELNYSIFSKSDTKKYDIDVFVIIEIFDTERLTNWRINITNRAAITIKEIYFPYICGISGQLGPIYGNEYLVYPKLDGIILHNPNETIDQIGGFWDIYPAQLSMQFMAYGEESIGLYVASYDSEGFIKRFGFNRNPMSAKDSLLLFISHLIPEFDGNDFNLSYNIVLGTYEGDWHETANIYKDWALNQPWTLKGTINQRSDFPQWWKKTSIIEIDNYNDKDLSKPEMPLANFSRSTESISNITGLNTTALIMGWEQNGSWIVPNAFPPREGNASFASAINAIKSDGNHGFVYISGTIWRVVRPDLNPPYNGMDYFLKEGLPYVALNSSLEPYYDEGYATIGWKAARMCVGTAKWKEYVLNNSIKAVDLGLDVLSIDEFPVGSIYPCYNDSHGHPIGYGRWQVNEYKTMLETIRIECRKRNPNFIISTEQPNEIYIPFIDTYVSRDNAPEYLIYRNLLYVLNNSIEFAPLFSYVYHEYITTFGEMLPIHNYSSSLFHILYNQHARSLGENFVRGKIQNAKYGNSSIIVPELLVLYNRTAQAIGKYCNKYSIEGSMLPAPKIIVPSINITWLYSYQPLIYGANLTSPAILHSAWKSPDNSIGYLFVNLKNEIIKFNFNVSTYNSPYLRYNIIKTTNGEREILYENTIPLMTINLILGFNDVVLIEIVPCFYSSQGASDSNDSKNHSNEHQKISLLIIPIIGIVFITVLLKINKIKKNKLKIMQ